MKIYDCFIFNHEVELLELRLNILNDYVDKVEIYWDEITNTHTIKIYFKFHIVKDERIRKVLAAASEEDYDSMHN